jgi:ceramide glucosyltransferase
VLIALHVFAGVFGAITVVSAGYCIFSALAALKFSIRRRNTEAASNLPPISILKSIKGADPEMYSALRSHCLQDYPEYEVLFGVSELNDPALPILEKLIAEFRDRKMRVVTCLDQLGPNRKVSTLAQLAALAAHEMVVVNDSDIFVPANYLRTLASELQRSGVGLVTCLYRGVPAITLPSKLESLGISTDFAAGVLAAQEIERGLHFGLGSTLAFRKHDLVAIGGFEAIRDYLADDYELGRRISNQGLRLELSRAVVETHLPAYDLAGFFRHQLRWARTIRFARPAGYAGLLLTFTLPWAVLTVAVAQAAPWAWGLLAAAVFARLGAALITGMVVLRDRWLPRCLWLLPLRDFLAPIIWLCSWAGRKIVWRGLVFEIEEGKLKQIP